MNTEKRKIGKQCAALFLAYVCLAWLFPYTGDDWSWGSSIGLERLNIFFRDYNGRYAGNLLVLALTRSKLLDALVMAASFLLVCVFSYGYAEEKNQASLLLGACLYFLMPKGMWAQVTVWTAGFTNYVPSALIAVAFLISVRDITGRELSNVKDTFGYGAGMYALAFVGALFVENITVFNICFGAAVIVWTLLRFRTYRKSHIGFFWGAVTGAIVMFANGAYDRIAQGEDYYRHMPVGLRDTVYFALEQAQMILKYILSDNLVFCFIVSVLLLTLAVHGMKNGKKWSGLLTVFHLGSLLLLWQEEIVTASVVNRFTLPKLLIHTVPLVVPLLYTFSILVMILYFVKTGRRFRMLLPFYCAVVSLGPLLVVNPIGPRCIFVGYFFMVIFTVDLFGYVCKQFCTDGKWLSRVLGLTVVTQFVFYFWIHYPIYYYDGLRLDFLRQQEAEGKQQVMICDLPNDDYLWTPTPGSGSWGDKYKLFYGLDETLQFVCIPYDQLESMVKNDF